MTALHRIERMIDVGPLLPDDGNVSIAATIVAPEAPLADPPAGFFCVPGGGLGRRYFDLRVADDTRFSFAARMAARGYVSVLLDPVGTGESSRPARGFDLVPDLHALALARATARVTDELRDGRLSASLPALPRLTCIGVGHSVGGMFTVFQQGRHRSFDALVLLGFGTGGMPSALDDEMRALVHDPAGVRANVVRLARRWYDTPYPELDARGRSREIYGGHADRGALAAMRDCRTCLLASASVFVIIPGSSSPETASVDVPVLLAVGDRDICGAAHSLPASFARSPDVTVVELAETGHSHFAFASVDRLFPRIADWVADVTARLAHGAVA